jgi:hypothetical protein
MFPGGGGRGKGGPLLMNWFLVSIGNLFSGGKNLNELLVVSWRRWRNKRPSSH